MTKNYLNEIESITNEIQKRGDVYELFYQRGYFHFLNEDDEKAQDDYKKALSLGLDATQLPYYAFSNSNSKRREFLLPEKIMVFLILIMVLAALAVQIFNAYLNLKH